MSTLEIGKGQGTWGANLTLWALYLAFAPVRLAVRVENAVHGVIGRIKEDQALFVLALRDIATGRSYGEVLDVAFPPEEK